jgi:hypothetical protein
MVDFCLPVTERENAMSDTVDRREFLKIGVLAGAAVVAGTNDSSARGFPGDNRIVRYAIHPSIGIARVGNSEDEFFLAPELPGEVPRPEGGFKDATGAVKRQGVRFRIYGFNARGRAVREITANEADISWTVHVANGKAGWYDFFRAMDIAEAEAVGPRNPSFQGASRDDLRVDAGIHSISGRSQSGVFLDGGTFLGESLRLGELRTDDAGRVIVLGGQGRALNPDGNPLTAYANNCGWIDDISDGPVRATVTINGATLSAAPAWVVVAPPNYAPSLSASITSYYDVLEQVMQELGFIRPDPRVLSFTAHILPIFARFGDLQWVNKQIMQLFGFTSKRDLNSPEFLSRLSDRRLSNLPFREVWFQAFRDPDGDRRRPLQIPQFYGDGADFIPRNPNQWMAVTQLQYERLRRWALGDFRDDFNPRARAVELLEDLPVRRQPATLDKAALDPVVGGPFHPGTEITWNLRTASLYSGAFRLKAAAAGVTTPQDYGPELTPEVALSADGPLSLSGPGDVTRWLAVPWHGDTANCRYGYNVVVDPYLPTFWPTRVPNNVLTIDDYKRVVDPLLPTWERQAAFQQRVDWMRDVNQLNYLATINNMIEDWPKLGFVTELPGPGNNIAPEVIKVETERELPDEVSPEPVHPSAWVDLPFIPGNSREDCKG